MKILVLFIEPMLYNLDLIQEVYNKTGHDFKYLYITKEITGRDKLILPDNALFLSSNKYNHFKEIKSELNAFNPDFVIVNGYFGYEQTLIIIYCQKHKIPYAIESDTPLHIPTNKIKAFLKKSLLQKLLCNEQCYGFPGGTKQKKNLVYYGIPENRNFIMPMSVSTSRLLRAAHQYPEPNELRSKFGLCDKKVFLFVGRLAPEKNVEALIRAFELLKRSHQEAALFIVGDGSELGFLKMLVKQLELADVFFTGYVTFPELVKYYKIADFFVLPSIYEPWGLVINEALTFALPVVTSDKVGCNTDLVKDNENGYIFDSSSYVDLYMVMQKCCCCYYDALSECSLKIIEKWNYQYYYICFNNALQQITL